MIYRISGGKIVEHKSPALALGTEAPSTNWRFTFSPDGLKHGYAPLYVSHGRPTFLLGNWYITGKWYYFPVAFFIKSTLPFMALLLLAVAGFSFGAHAAAPESTERKSIK